MLKFVIKKLLYGILVLFGVITVVFFLFNIKPGDPALMVGGQNATADVIENIQKDLGLNEPLHRRYGLYLNDISPISVHETLDVEDRTYLDTAKYSYVTLFHYNDHSALVLKFPYFGRSYQTDKKVSEILWETLPPTIILAVSAILLATLIGMFFGVVGALYKGSFFDNSLLVFSVFGMSLPSYFTAIIISWIGGYLWYETTYLPQLPFFFILFGVLFGIGKSIKNKNLTWKSFEYGGVLKFGFIGMIIGGLVWFVGLGINGLFQTEVIPFVDSYYGFMGTGLEMEGSLYDVDDLTAEEYLSLYNLILPALTLGVRPLAIVMQLMRSSLLEVMDQDYIRTARAKGLGEYKVLMKHAMKNALNPVVTAVSGWFASMLAGAVFIETIFSWNGIGKKVFDSLDNNDFPVVMGAVLVIASFFVFINIVVDIIYGFLDPRIRIKD